MTGKPSHSLIRSSVMMKLLIFHIFGATTVLATFDIVLILPNTYGQSVPSIPQGYVHHAELKTAYKLHSDRFTWSSAKDACISEGGRLAVIDSPQKLEKIKIMRQTRNLVWTGMWREPRTPNWKTVEGGSISSDTPRINFFPYTYGDCVAVIGINVTTRLIAQPCNFPRGYVCEIPDSQRDNDAIPSL